MAEDEKAKAEFLAKTKKIEGILLQIGKVEDSIAKLNTRIKEAEEAAAAPGPKGDSQGSVGSPPPLNNQAEVIVVLEKALKKAQAALVKLNTKLNKYAGRRRTRRGGAQPPFPNIDRAKIDEISETLDAQDGSESEVLEYLILLKRYHPKTFNKQANRDLVEAIKLRQKHQPFMGNVRAIMIEFRVNPDIRGGAQPPPPRPTREKLDELNRNLMANPNDAGNVLDYLVAVLSHHRDVFDAVETSRLTNAVRLRNRGEPFAPRVMEIVRSLRLAIAPPPLPVLARLRPPADIGGRHRTSRRTRKSRKTRRS